MQHDLRLALRTLSKTPGFTAVAILTLALGISMSTAAFSLANTFLMRAVPYPHADRIVRIFRTVPQSQTAPHAPANLLDVRAMSTSFANLACFYEDSASLAEPGQPAQQVLGINATTDFFAVVGVQPALGRSFTADEDQPDKGKVVVITHRMWTRRFGSDPGVINRSLRLDGETYTIVGVLPASFDAPLVWGPAELVRPLTIWPHFRTERMNSWFHAVGRLRDGVSLAQAQSELHTIAANLARAYPKELGTDGLRATDLNAASTDPVTRSILWLMVALSTLVLLIACANLASLQLARGLDRMREYAVRSALGAGRRHLMMPLLAESLVLALAGGTTGILFASWTTDLIGRNLLINNESGFDIPLDWHVMTFALIAALASGVVFGLAPAWFASRASAGESLKEGSRGSTVGRSHQRLKSALIVGELAAALVLVGVATSFGIATKKFVRRDVGWTPDGLFAGYIGMPWNRYGDDHHCREFTRTLLERLAAVPGLEQVALSSGLPVYSFDQRRNLVAEGRDPVPRGQEPLAQTASVSADYFAALRIPLRKGQLFAASLKADDPAVAIVNESVARLFWPGVDAVGKRLRFADNNQWIEIIGVVGDTRMAANLAEPDTRLQVFRPLVQDPQHYLALALRSSQSPETLANPVRQVLASLDPDLPLAQPGSLRQSIDLNLSNLNLVVANLGSFAFMGLLISAIGLYGVISHLTAQRTRDIGVRMALGATYTNIMGMILREGGLLLAVGLVLGVPGYLGMNALFHRSMPEMPLPGPWLLAINLVLLTLMAFGATWLPAHRAARLSPVNALRSN